MGGFGYITLDKPDEFVAPEITDSKAKKKFEKNKELWFCRSDIISTDSAVGVEKDAAVRFTVYTDEKGIGAQDIRPAAGDAFSNVKWELKRGPKPKKTKKKKKKQKRNATQAFNMMQGFQGFSGAQIVVMNGVPFMMMPMGGPVKKRKKNKKKNKNKKKQGQNTAPMTTTL